jgi:hypothetical protein
MRKKNRSHFCKACGQSRPNEKFSGKGHRQHICKDCKREGRIACHQSTSDYDRKLSYLSKAIKNCMILYTEKVNFFLFEFQGARYITSDDSSPKFLSINQIVKKSFCYQNHYKNTKRYWKSYIVSMTIHWIVDSSLIMMKL